MRKKEEQDATFYQEHKDDPDEWGEAEASPPQRRLAAMVSVRLAPEEESRLRRIAADRGESLSEFFRKAALERAGAGKMAAPQIISSATTASAGGAIEMPGGSFLMTGSSRQVAASPPSPFRR
jgi:hypothetical protein